MKNKNKITHIISTDLKRNVWDIVQDISKKGVDVIKVIGPTSSIFIHATDSQAKSLFEIKGIQAISPNYPIRAL